MTSLKILDTIKYNKSINIFHDLNSATFIFANKKYNNFNTTKRIHIKNNQSKTRRNQYDKKNSIEKIDT